MNKFPNHINSIYLSDIYEEIIHQFSYVGLVLRHKQLTHRILTVGAFPANTAHSPNFGLISVNVADDGLTLKQL